MAIITGKESMHQLGKGCEASETITQRMADKASSIRHQYEQRQAIRKAEAEVANQIKNLSPKPQPTANHLLP